MSATAALTMKTILQFRPRYIAMAGIAAGVEGEADFGHVLVADSAFDYEAGKRKLAPDGKSTLAPAPYPIPLDPTLKAKVSLLSQEPGLSQAILEGWTDTTASPVKIHIGPFASGASVIADNTVVDSVLGRNRKLIGIDMETYGFFVACRAAPEPRPMVFAAKSVCDFANAEKSARYQEYAAHTSARFIFELALRCLAQSSPVAGTLRRDDSLPNAAVAPPTPS